MSSWSVSEAKGFITGVQKRPPVRFLVRVGEMLVATDGHMLVAKPNRGTMPIPKAFRHPKESFAQDIARMLADSRGRRFREWYGFYRWIESEAGDTGELAHHVRVHGRGLNPKLVHAALRVMFGGAHAVALDRAHQRRGRGESILLRIPRGDLEPLHIFSKDAHAIVMPMRLNDVRPKPRTA